MSIVLTAAFVALAFFVFDTSYLRFAESAKDLWNSIRIYFCEIFGIRHSIEATVLNRSDVMSWNILLPADFESFTQKAKAYFGSLKPKRRIVDQLEESHDTPDPLEQRKEEIRKRLGR